MKQLQLIFVDAEERDFRLNVPAPRESFTDEEIERVMTRLVALNIFHSKGERLVRPKAARLIDRQVTTVYSA